MKDQVLIAEVLLPIASPDCIFDYLIPTFLVKAVQFGKLVLVPLGEKRHDIGVVMATKPKILDPNLTYKHLLEVYDSRLQIHKSQIELWRWMSRYYLQSLGDIFATAFTWRAYLKQQHDCLIGITKIDNSKPEYSSIFQTVANHQKYRVVVTKLKHDQIPFFFKLLEQKYLTLQTPVKDQIEVPPNAFESTFTTKLNQHQAAAYAKILSGFKSQNIVLLHGITSSGKTIIYAKLAHTILIQNRQVLFLVPEIALTIQLIRRLEVLFKTPVAVYHSGLTKKKRHTVWRGVQNGKCLLVLGTRSAIFLPFRNLNLIIIDEEHDSSYKEETKKPFYNARDVALMLSRLQNIKVLLGSATPALESYFLSEHNFYLKVELLKRYGDVELPRIELIDLSLKQVQRKLQHNFSAEMLRAIELCLVRKQQIILFQNRRGYAPFIVCTTCDNVPSCKHCAVTLTYHLKTNRLKCHYCGYEEPAPKVCPACSSPELRTVGWGTQKIEETLKLLFPNARIDRLDFDNTRRKGSYEKIIKSFEEHQIDILVGTQMVGQGLNFDKVHLIGVIGADMMMYLPDFRAQERFFQTLVQVSGRAGRKQKQGKVLIQTYTPQHPIFKFIQKTDYKNFYQYEIALRRAASYPPFSRFIKLVLRSKNEARVKTIANITAEALLDVFDIARVLGPEAPPVHKVADYFLQHLIIKFKRGNQKRLEHEKEKLRQVLEKLKVNKYFSGVNLRINVDM